MISGDTQLGGPGILYVGTQAAIEALSGLSTGAHAYAIDKGPGWFNGTTWEWVVPGNTESHHTVHEAGGADEISVEGLSGRLADPQNADTLVGKAVPELGVMMGTGLVLLYDIRAGGVMSWVPMENVGIQSHGELDNLLEDHHPQYLTIQRGDQNYAPKQHASDHGNYGDDKINVEGLSGKLADLQDAGWLRGHPVVAPGFISGNDYALMYNGYSFEVVKVPGTLKITDPAIGYAEQICDLRVPSGWARFPAAGEVDLAPLREQLTADRTYYVRTDGNDTNSGLYNSSSTAFRTIQHAIDVVASSVDACGHTVIIQVGDGTYTESIELKDVPGIASKGDLLIRGNLSNPAGVVVQNANNYDDCFRAFAIRTPWHLEGLKIVGTLAPAVHAAAGAYISFNKINFGAVTGTAMRQIRAADGGMVEGTIGGEYTISGGATNHAIALNGTVRIENMTVTITGTPAFTAFATVFGSGMAYFTGCTFVGFATGPRYSVSLNGVLWLAGVTLPGSSVGTTDTGGQVN